MWQAATTSHHTWWPRASVTVPLISVDNYWAKSAVSLLAALHCAACLPPSAASPCSLFSALSQLLLSALINFQEVLITPCLLRLSILPIVALITQLELEPKSWGLRLSHLPPYSPCPSVSVNTTTTPAAAMLSCCLMYCRQNAQTATTTAAKAVKVWSSIALSCQPAASSSCCLLLQPAAFSLVLWVLS